MKTHSFAIPSGAGPATPKAWYLGSHLRDMVQILRFIIDVKLIMETLWPDTLDGALPLKI